MNFDINNDEEYFDQHYSDYLSRFKKYPAAFLKISKIEGETDKAYKVVGILKTEVKVDGSRNWKELLVDRWIPKKALMSSYLEIDKYIPVKFWLVKFIEEDAQKINEW